MGSLLSEVLSIAIMMALLIIISLIVWNVFSPIKDEDNNLQDLGIRGLTILGVLLVIVAVIMPFRVKDNFIEKYKTIDKLGPIGDFIGGTTVAFLTAASVVLLLATIIMQRKEIKISQQSIVELVKQTETSVKQAEEARKETKITNETMKQQQFETTFFNMLSLHHQIVNNIKISELKKTHTGREAIARLKDIFENGFAQEQYFLDNPEKGIKDWIENPRLKKEYLVKLFDNADTITQERLDEIYEQFHDTYGNDIGHYMRNNYRIVKFIVNNVADDENEQKRIKEETGREPIIGDTRYYFGTLRAQWSNAEFELILINSLYSENRKFKNLILKHDVLDMEDTEDGKILEVFKLKESMSKFKAYRKLIEVKK